MGREDRGDLGVRFDPSTWFDRLNELRDGKVLELAPDLIRGRGSDFPYQQATKFKPRHYRAMPHYSCRSSVRYWMAWAMWAAAMRSSPAKSAMVRATLRMRV